MSERYNLPIETARVVNSHFAQCKNLSLILDKYVPARIVAESKQKGSWLQGLLRENHLDATLAKSAYNRWRAMMLVLGAALFEATLDWRMVVGLGGTSVLETALTLHRLYGIPFIPASALKGLTRAYLTSEIEGYQEDDNAEVKRIFGSQKQAGSVLFFDAMPKDGKATIVPDIMNPHYSDYYRDKQTPPTNDQDPIPVPFLTVTDTTFTFALAPRSAITEEERLQYNMDVENVKGWLQKALQDYGIGGKTSAGYGYFQKDQPAQEGSQEATMPAEHIRPNLPSFREGQVISGLVLATTDEMHRLQPDARIFLQHRPFLPEHCLIAIVGSNPNWVSGQTRNCILLHEEEVDGCIVLKCRPKK